MQDDELMRIDRAAARLGRSVRTMQRWGAAGRLAVYRDRRGVRYFRRREIEDLAPRLVNEAAPPGGEGATQ